jgi:hypothetical protein
MTMCLSPWMTTCLDMEMETNLTGYHGLCQCKCRRCYQLNWLKLPHKCKCRHGSSLKRWLSLEEKIKCKRRGCHCELEEDMSWTAWYCTGCIEEHLGINSEHYTNIDN